MGNKSDALEIIQDAIKQSAEGLLNDTGVDEKEVHDLAVGIEKELRRRQLLVKNGPRGVGHYLFIVADDTEPELRGPYATLKERDKEARGHRREDTEKADGLYTLDINQNGIPTTGFAC